jgi:hypothetical protein
MCQGKWGFDLRSFGWFPLKASCVNPMPSPPFTLAKQAAKKILEKGA